MLSKFWMTLFLSATLLAGCVSKPDAYDSNGIPIRVSDYRGKWLVVNYWASWCEPCVKEMAELNTIYTNNKDKVMILGVNYEHASNKSIQQFSNKLAVTFPMLPTFPKERYGIKSINTLPTTLLISPRGKLKTILHGPQTEQGLEKAMGLA